MSQRLASTQFDHKRFSCSEVEARHAIAFANVRQAIDPSVKVAPIEFWEPKCLCAFGVKGLPIHYRAPLQDRTRHGYLVPPGSRVAAPRDQFIDITYDVRRRRRRPNTTGPPKEFSHHSPSAAVP
jgi:hypothetical protein